MALHNLVGDTIPAPKDQDDADELAPGKAPSLPTDLRERAEAVLAKKSRSYVEDAEVFARYLLGR